MSRDTKIMLALSTIFFVMIASQSLFAQAPAPVVAPVQSSPGGGFIVRPLWVEIAITVAMFGLALFAVGRSSNRS
ncbi:hypothetical protein [Thalassoglobus sp.]|uniref:hypothetical protein n=1 Tax=Thalassoglobus sp. TaxID=2795869 RepID=UPI003AA8BDB8